MNQQKIISLPFGNGNITNTEQQEDDYDVVFVREAVWENKFSYSNNEPTLDDLRRDIPDSLKLESEKAYISKARILKK